MLRETITGILEAEGAKGSAKGMTLPDRTEVTFFVTAPGDVFPVSRVVKVELKDKHLCLSTAKAERFFFAYEDVLGFKMEDAEPRDRGTGFSR